MQVGRQLWAITEGCIPPNPNAPTDPHFVCHEAAGFLNANDDDSHVAITLHPPGGLGAAQHHRLFGLTKIFRMHPRRTRFACAT